MSDAEYTTALAHRYALELRDAAILVEQLPADAHVPAAELMRQRDWPAERAVSWMRARQALAEVT